MCIKAPLVAATLRSSEVCIVVSCCHGVDKDVAVDMLLLGITQGTVSPISRIIITGTNTSKYK